MGKHYLKQDREKFTLEGPDSDGVWHVGGSVCGAVCTLYLLREYLISEMSDVGNDWEAEHFASCWGDVSAGKNFSNPFLIKRYLEEIQKKTKAVLSACPKIVEGKLEDNILFGLLASTLGDAGYTEKVFDEYFNNGGNDEAYEYFLGVFVNVEDLPDVAKEEGKPVPPGTFGTTPMQLMKWASKFHYILLQRQTGGQYKFINPHIGEWDKQTKGKIENSFYLADGNGKTWKWLNFGLYIKKKQWFSKYSE